ncbi:MAG: tyrosine-protein phosphatase [Solirubrobacteraceae bacterium]
MDDGPPTVEEAVAMVGAAVEAGIGTLAVTPHLRSDYPHVRADQLAERLDGLRAELADQVDSIQLVTGAECSLVWALEADTDKRRLASFGQRGRDLLIETPPSVFGIDRLLYELQMAGYRITLAHPERSHEFQNRERLVALAQQGILLQVNAESLLGDGGASSIRRTARWMCTEGVAHVLASDAHRGYSWRPIGRLSLAAELLARLVGVERAEWMATRVPAAIVSGEALPPTPEPQPERRRRLLRLRRS